MKKRIKLALLGLLCFAFAISLFSLTNGIEAKADSSPVWLYIGAPDNIVESGTITNQQFGVVVSEPGYVYIRLPDEQTEMRIVYTSTVFMFTQDGLYTIYRFSPQTNPGQNNSLNLQITLYATAPKISLFENGNLTASNSFVTGNICATAIYGLSGIKSFEVSKDGSNFVPYNNEVFSNDGVYEFLAIDNAGNESRAIITKDTIKPIVAITSDGAALANNSFSNVAAITFTVNEVNAIGYVYRASTNQTISTISGESFLEEDTYMFSALDAAGNQSDEVTITIDKTAPIGNFYVDGSLVATPYINATNVCYTASDKNPFNVYAKYPDSGTFTLIENSSTFNAEGIYSFYAEDAAGNQSAIQTITIDRISPVITLYAYTAQANNGTCISAEYIYALASDDASGIKAIYMKSPSSNEYSIYTANTKQTAEGDYSFYCEDNAGNASIAKTICLDRSAPLGVLYINGSTAENNSHTNKPFSYAATDNVGGTNKLEIKRPGGVWETYASGTAITGEDGTYFFRATDNAGNVSGESKVILDTILPTTQVLGGGIAKETDTYTGAATLQFSAFDENLLDCYMKLPNESLYKKIFSGTAYSVEGRYEFYAIDKAGNQSALFTITLDKTAPAGTLHVDGSIVLSNSHTNKAFSYVATDNFSGVNKLEIKKPNGNWETYFGEMAVTGIDGLYCFRATDNVGNISDEISIVYDTVPPVVVVYAGIDAVTVNSFTNAEYIKFSAIDLYLDSCYVKLPNETEFVIADLEMQYNTIGRYEFYALDKAGNKSDIHVITLDNSRPRGTIYVDGLAVENNGYTNKAFSYNGQAGLSGLSYLEIKRPNGDWERYIAETTVSASSANGKYIFRCVDNTGNVSDESAIHLDTAAPGGSLYADETSMQSGSYTNALRICLISESSDLKAVYVKTPSDTNFQPTNSGALYSKTGRYEFYVMDFAGNISEIYVITIDRTPKAVVITNVENGAAMNNVAISYSNILNGAPIILVTVNGINVDNNTIINTINNGRYEVKCVDEAGNIWTSTFTASRTDIETVTPSQYWWEAKDIDGNTYAFETYEKALTFKMGCEQAFVKVKTWNGDTWDAGYIMDSADAVNAKQGTFYLYKKFDNRSIEVAYFTLERLNAVIKSYAEQGIAKYYYWEKNPAAAYTANDIYMPFTNGKIVAKSIALRANLSYKIDGVITNGLSFSLTGAHTLTVFDYYGNSYNYDIVIVSSAPELEFRYGNGDYYLASSNQPYYLKNRITIKAKDNLDEFAMIVVKNSKDEVINTVNLNEELIISEAGKYIIQTVNHGGMSKYVFYISYNAPNISVNENAINKRLEVSIAASSDRDMELLGVNIFRSENGADWTLLDADDYGLDVNTDHLKYSFFKTGYYKIAVEDICRSGIDAVVYEIYYEKPEPIGTLNGVNENGYSNTSVSFAWADEAYANLFHNGVETEYSSGTVLTEEGNYKLTFRDLNGYSKEYVFVIDKIAPEPITAKNTSNGYVKENSITWDKEGVIAAVYFNNVLTMENYAQGTPLTDNGQYRVELRDLADNVSVVEFVIDNTAPAASLEGVENGGRTKSSVKLTSLSKEAEITAYRNGIEFEYRIGNSLSNVGKYRIVLTDAAGNTTEYSFEILYSVNAAGVVFIVIVIVAAIAAVVLIVLMRKKKLFKKRT